MKILVTVALSVALSLVGAYFLLLTASQVPTASVESHTGFARMMKTGELRCGFQYWDGGLMRDENTGKITGAMAEVAEQIAKNAEVKLTWVGPIEWGNIPMELETGKIDAWCATTWLDGRRSKFMLISDPVAYNGFEAFVRWGDTRFDISAARLDNSDITMAVLENTSSGNLSLRLLPHAKPYFLPSGTATDMDIAVNIAAGKADVGFTSPGILHQYMKNNPNSIKRISPDQPYAIMGASFTVGADDFRMLHFLNTSLAELRNTGFINEITKKYNAEYPGLFVTSR